MLNWVENKLLAKDLKYSELTNETANYGVKTKAYVNSFKALCSSLDRLPLAGSEI